MVHIVRFMQDIGFDYLDFFLSNLFQYYKETFLRDNSNSSIQSIMVDDGSEGAAEDQEEKISHLVMKFMKIFMHMIEPFQMKTVKVWK